MSISTLSSTVVLSPTSHDLMERDQDWCAQYAQQYVVYLEHWDYNPYGLPVLERQVLFAGPDLEQAQRCFGSTIASGEHGTDRVMLCFTGSYHEEFDNDPRADWDLGGEGGGN